MNDNHKKHVYRWEECYAKLVLEQTFPERFSQLEIADKPDLQDDLSNMGVEVTTAIAKNEKEKDHLFSELVQGHGTPERQKKSKERIRQLGGIYHDPGVMSSWVDYRDLNRIYSALESKLEKLNAGGYRNLDKQLVFITDTNIIRPDELNEVWTEIAKRQEVYSKRFDSIFLYLFGGKLIEFDMKTGNIRCYVVQNVTKLAERAIHISEGTDLTNEKGGR